MSSRIILEPLLTLQEVAAILRLPESTLYQQRLRGVEPGSLGLRVGRFVRFRAETIEDFIERQASNGVGRGR